jgi:hypothetical protein
MGEKAIISFIIESEQGVVWYGARPMRVLIVICVVYLLE